MVANYLTYTACLLMSQNMHVATTLDFSHLSYVVFVAKLNTCSAVMSVYRNNREDAV